MIKIEMLRTFAEVARTGNLIEAAEALRRTPSAVSMTLKSLEENLGRPLFETERKNRLTALGRFTLEMAERELSHFNRTLASITDFASAGSGEVRIAAVPSFANAVLPGLVRDFLALHPRVRLDIHDLDSASILRALERERIDLGIVSDARPSLEFTRTRLGADVFGVVVRRDDPLARRGRIDWRDLPRERLLANPLAERIEVPELQAALDGAPLRVHNTTTLIAMVRAGLGITVLPELVSRHGVPDLAVVALHKPVVRRELHLLSRARDTPSPATAAFAAHIERHAAEALPDPADPPDPD